MLFKLARLTESNQRAIVEVLRKSSFGQHQNRQEIPGDANQRDKNGVRNGRLRENMQHSSHARLCSAASVRHARSDETRELMI